MRILIVDDHILFREGLVGLLRSQNDMDVVGECGSVQEAIDAAAEYKPDVILMDFSLPDGTGLDATRAILATLPAGAKGYLLKNRSVSKLLASLRALQRGEAAISRTMMARILEEFAQPKTDTLPSPSLLIGLTSREIEVLRELANGITNQEIATRLYISENTVKNHLHNILEKLNLHNRREAIDFARKNGLAPTVPRR